jgi:hypothetical protein
MAMRSRNEVVDVKLTCGWSFGLEKDAKAIYLFSLVQVLGLTAQSQSHRIIRSLKT